MIQCRFPPCIARPPPLPATWTGPTCPPCTPTGVAPCPPPARNPPEVPREVAHHRMVPCRAWAPWAKPHTVRAQSSQKTEGFQCLKTRPMATMSSGSGARRPPVAPMAAHLLVQYDRLQARQVSSLRISTVWYPCTCREVTVRRLQPRPRPPTRGSTPCTRVTTKQWCRVTPWVGAHPVLEAHPILRLLLTIISVGAPGVNRDSRPYPHLPLWLICNSITYQRQFSKTNTVLKFTTKKWRRVEEKKLHTTSMKQIRKNPKTKNKNQNSLNPFYLSSNFSKIITFVYVAKNLKTIPPMS